ncbi:CehA/McbA family metallohydrolase [Clostridium sp. YIM B02551]|uniref:CehA/McbA family metallohydrolase n=1 Tax=Clostridium sp. YIM B02551 TaxID=2910679 RepID=UPI001EEAEC90
MIRKEKRKWLSIIMIFLMTFSNFLNGTTKIAYAAGDDNGMQMPVYPMYVYQNEEFAISTKANDGYLTEGDTPKFSIYNGSNMYGTVKGTDGTWSTSRGYNPISIGVNTVKASNIGTGITSVSLRIKKYPASGSAVQTVTIGGIIPIIDSAKYGYIAGSVSGTPGDMVEARDSSNNIIGTAVIDSNKAFKIAVINGEGITLGIYGADGVKKAPIYGTYAVTGGQTTSLISQNNPLNAKSVKDQTIAVGDNPLVFNATDLFTDTNESSVITITNSTATPDNTVNLEPSNDKKSISISGNPSVLAAQNATVTVTGTDNQGNTATCIIKLTVNPKDVVAPTIDHTPITSNFQNKDLSIDASITDNMSVTEAKVFYRTKGETEYNSVNMTANNNSYSAIIPHDKLETTGLEYYIQATDGKNISTSPADKNKPYSVTITPAQSIDDYNIYFGQLHSHTTNSDGIGTLDDAYSHAKDVAKLDFFAVTDHSNSFDNGSASSMADASKSVKWNNGLNAADKYTDNNFAGIYAFEMTWSDGTGHINTFDTPGFESRDTQKYKNADGLQQYYNVLKQFPNSVSQFNHPGTTFGDFKDFANYDPQIDKLITLIEVGNGEGAIGSSGYFPSYSYYDRALQKGWHVAPTNNQDNHKGMWGDANTARTVVLADSLSRDNIYDAIRNRRTYATEDNDLKIKYTLNDAVMGTIFDSKPNDVDIKVDLEDPDNEALGKVSVIVDGGKELESKTLTTSKDSLEFKLPAEYSYYYIKVVEADKDTAVTAPVWISETDKSGISATTSSTSLPIKDSKMTITSNLYNNENSPMKVKSLEYSINGNVINTAGSIADVNSLGTGSYSFDYTPTTAGKYNVDVKLVATINGVDKVYTDVLKLNVADPAVVTNIVVDGSHYNDYVNGYYAGNMKNLTTLANGENINVIVQKDKLTDDVLKDAKLLILSPPAKKSGSDKNTGVNYSASPYTDDEIAVIQRYAQRGGNIIVTGLADYQDSRNDSINHSAYQQNRILEAIGAGSRINDDEVVDYDNNPNVNPPGKAGGTPYRVPMNSFNTSSPYLNSVVSGQAYSFYSGCSITLGDKATWLVKGTPTTYGFDSDNDKLGGSYVSSAASAIPSEDGSIGKGNMVALATETLSGGGKLFVGGTVFYSDFEIKATLDNYGQLQNSNYNIMMNILDSIKNIISITPIKQARSGEFGQVFSVEGTVTAGTKSGNAFFDTIYIQDKTGGINIYPVSGMDIELGEKVKVTGTLDQYLGDKELRVISIEVTDKNVNPLEPTFVSTKDAMSDDNGGTLLKVQGQVTKVDIINGVVSAIYVKDETGVVARLFVDGYIDYSDHTSAKLEQIAKVGNTISGIGLASTDPEGNRLRVRDRSEIKLVSSGGQSEDQVLANSVIEKISKIPADILLSDETNVVAARTAYDALTDKQKALVTNYDILTAAEKKIAELKEIASIPAKIKNDDVTAVLNAINSAIKYGVQIPVIDITSSPIVSKDIFNAIKGLDKQVTFVGNNVSWTFNGKDIKTEFLSDIDLSLKTVSVDLKSKEIAKVKEVTGKDALIVPFSFNYDGPLPANALVKVFVGKDWIGKIVDVCRYYPDKNTYDKIQSEVKVDTDGYITYNTNHCSDYFIIDSTANNPAATASTSAVNLPKTGSIIGSTILITVGLLFVIMGACLIIFRYRRNRI